jgi:hypothetical protein
MGWILEFIGVAVGSAVVPITLAVTSSHVSPYFITYAPPIGTACAIAAWLATTKGMYGSINVNTTFNNWPMFTGCLVGIMLPFLGWLVMRPFMKVPYDWGKLYRMEAVQPWEGARTYEDGDETDGAGMDFKELAKASKMAKIVTGVLCFIFLVLIPFPLYGTGYIFSKGFFTGWTVLVFIWSWAAALLIWGMPIWQSREQIGKVFKGAFGKGVGDQESITGVSTPVESVKLETMVGVDEKQTV